MRIKITFNIKVVASLSAKRPESLCKQTFSELRHYIKSDSVLNNYVTHHVRGHGAICHDGRDILRHLLT